MLDELKAILRACELCPRLCRVNRLAGEVGRCGAGPGPEISSLGPHFGEEPPLVGLGGLAHRAGGSGTIFFTGCNLGCVFCQNFEISHCQDGRRITEEALADAMLGLERIGCHNVNWVTPTHQVPAILAALRIARSRGLSIPTVFNCGGYERVEILRMIEGQVDIYMPDAKFFSPATAERFASAPDYPKVAQAALMEMHRQVGDLQIRDGIAARGLLVRHLVMPGCGDESIAILDFIAREISPNTYVNVMDQYRPAYRAHEFPEISRRITRSEYLRVLRHAEKLGLRVS